MVEAVFDPIRLPTITLSQAELDEIQEQIRLGALPPDWLERHAAAVQANVFGHDHRVDSRGRPIEQGRGSASNMSQQSIDAYKKWCKDEPGYAQNLKRMEEQLAECNERRAETRRSRA